MKAVYNAPVVKTDKVEMGVFGQYGSGCRKKRRHRRRRWYHWLCGC